MRLIPGCNKVILFVVCLVVFACQQEKQDSRKEDPTKADTLFALVTSSGVDFANKLEFNGKFNILEYLYYYNGGGVAVADVNNDELPDLFFTGNEVSNRLYINRGDLKFEDVTQKAGLITENIWSTGATFVDINYDGWMDLYVCNLGNFGIYDAANHLYVNQKDGTFKEQAAEFGLDFSGLSTQSAFFDFDRDGDLDMYLLNHSYHDINSYTRSEKRKLADSIAGDKLYENLSAQGTPQFRDVTAEAGIYSSHLGYGLGIGVADVNNDGWPDIYVSNDFHENDYLYINDRDGTFSESGEESFGHQTRFSMGNDLADIDQDGLTDIMTLDMMPFDHQVLMRSGGEDKNKVSQIKKMMGYHDQYSRNALQLNKGNGKFVDVALMEKVYATDWSWSVLINDYDNDGKEDIYIANGIYKRPNDLDFVNFKSNVDFRKFKDSGLDSIRRKIIDSMPSGHLANIIYWGSDNGAFAKNDLGKPSFSNGAAYADLDNDGDLDLVNNNLNETATIYENKTENNFLKIKLSDKSSNVFGIGSRVILYLNGERFNKELYLTRGFQSSVNPEIIFGLGEAEKADSLQVLYNGKIKTFYDIRADQTIRIDLAAPDFRAVPVIEKDQGSPNLLAIDYTHEEDRFYDYESETLIPFSLSKRGPALATGDFNSDGLQDLYVGGAHDQAGVIFIQSGKEKGFLPLSQAVLERDKAYEDTDAVFLDIDNDGDQDLIVISGGNKYRLNDLRMKHRLYINNNGTLERDPAFNRFGSNGSCVRPFDFDNDGYIDVFIGSISVPLQYGISPRSFFLENQGDGKMIPKEIPGLQGMITDAVWTDFDTDGDFDLIAVGLWMKPILLENREGKLLINKGFFPEKLSGWWNTVDAGDLNGDGRPDFVLGNFGLNGAITASPEEPVSLYLEDFDNNGRQDPVTFRYYNGREIPLFPKDDLVAQMPFLKKNFQQYTKFSEILGPADLFGKKVSPAKQVNTMASVMILNLPDQREVISLPDEAQLSAINDIVITDADGDGKNDVLFAGNYETQVAQYGLLDANSGGFLKGNGRGQLQYAGDLPLKHFARYNKIVKITIDSREVWLVAQNEGKIRVLSESDFR